MTLWRANPNGTYTQIAQTTCSSVAVPVSMSITDYPDTNLYGSGNYTYYLSAETQYDQMVYTNLNLAGVAVKK